MGSSQALRIAGTNASIISESLIPSNSVADPGELLTFSLSLKNNSSTASTAFSASLLPIGGVSAPSAPQNYGIINAGSTVTRDYSFKLEGGCGISVPLVL
jgi:hypothetical protein